jgi:hypothetical protein
VTAITAVTAAVQLQQYSNRNAYDSSSSSSDEKSSGSSYIRILQPGLADLAIISPPIDIQNSQYFLILYLSEETSAQSF